MKKHISSTHRVTKDFFHPFARRMSIIVGSSSAFFVALGVIFAWLWLGPVFHFSQEWQLMINTITTITTFLMVFVMHNTQNRDTAAMHIKLNELLRIHKGARDTLLTAEDFSDGDLEQHHAQFMDVANGKKFLSRRVSGRRVV